MENKSHRLIAVDYEMYVDDDGQLELKEVTSAGRPFRFVSGLGYTLDALENALIGLSEGDDFEVRIPKGDAFGEYDDQAVVKLPKSQFVDNGKVTVNVGQVVGLHDQEGNVYNATVEEIGVSEVTLDLNHPYAGYDLVFKGRVITSHEASEAELNEYLNQMTGGGCGCGHCGGGCDDGCCSDGHQGCGCGH